MNYSIAFAQCLISVGILVWIWTGPFARFRRDNFRSRIRNIRDGLFDFMYQGEYSFASPAYQTTRQLLNGMIRCSNYFSVLTFFHAMGRAIRDETRAPGAATVEIDKLPDGELKQALKAAIDKAMGEMLKFVFIKRISGLMTVLVLLVIYIFCAGCSWLKKKSPVSTNEFVERPASHLLEEAYELGKPKLSSQNIIMLAR